MAFARVPTAKPTHGAAAGNGEHPPPGGDADTRRTASQSTGEPARVAEGDRSPTNREHGEEPAWVSWFLWGGFLGLVFGVVGGASGGASLVEGWGGSRVFAIIGAVIGALLGAPVGVVLGWLIGALVFELIVPLLLTIPLLTVLEIRRRWVTRR
jgi:hypothetical protein